MFVVCFAVASSIAQAKMVGAGYGILAPGCTNCTSLSGFNLFGGMAVNDKIVATLNLGFFSKTDGAASLNSTAIGISGDYYLKEALNGFFVGPDLTYIMINEKINGTEVFSQNNLTIGINAGWAIALGESWRLVPHFGYGTWYDNSSGRLTAGLKVGYVLP